MPRLRDVSARECIHILTKHFGFIVRRQRGSHIVLVKISNGVRVGTVVPNHSQIKIGTLIGVLKLANVPIQEFSEYV